jgi:hypothetical protein
MKRKLRRTIPDEVILNKILLIRGKKVMLDRDLAELYGVSTQRLNEQVKRNLNKFPKDFMFRLNNQEKKDVSEGHPYLASLKFSPSLPYAFTEHGALMLSSVLNSKRASEMNIHVIRVFVKVREVITNYKDILLKIELLEKKTIKNTDDIQLLFKYIKSLIISEEQVNRRRIGFRRNGEKD